jgi:hypothetical protein
MTEYNIFESRESWQKSAIAQGAAIHGIIKFPHDQEHIRDLQFAVDIETGKIIGISVSDKEGALVKSTCDPKECQIRYILNPNGKPNELITQQYLNGKWMNIDLINEETGYKYERRK